MQDFVQSMLISQVIPQKKIDALIQKWQINKGVIKFTTEKLLQVLIHGVVLKIENLRDLSAVHGIAKSTIDDALKKRCSGFFEELVNLLLIELISVLPSSKQRQEVREIIAIDSSVCNVHGSLATQFIATKMRAQQAAVKLHAAWNVKHEWIEEFMITGYRRHDGAVGKRFHFKSGKTYVFDRAYIDVSLWQQINSQNAHFVTRLKKHGKRLNYIHNGIEDINLSGVLYDQVWTPSEAACYRSGIKPRVFKYRHIVYRDAETKKLFDFITSDFEAPAQEIADIYRKRWAVELLFRWLKGHLNIRRFAFKNLNAAKVLLSVNVIVQLLIRFKMLKENFQKSSWDYLRSLRNIKNQIAVETHSGEPFHDDSRVKAAPEKHFLRKAFAKSSGR